jgi:hypothetical protein
MNNNTAIISGQGICGKANVNLVFLPEYSPDFNSIEKDRATMKRTLHYTSPFCDLLQTACLRLLVLGVLDIQIVYTDHNFGDQLRKANSEGDTGKENSQQIERELCH